MKNAIKWKIQIYIKTKVVLLRFWVSMFFLFFLMWPIMQHVPPACFCRSIWISADSGNSPMLKKNHLKYFGFKNLLILTSQSAGAASHLATKV